MSFDWFTFVAQLVNFGLLLLLLRIFLYRPVLNLMEERQQRLSRAWDDAREAEEQARAEAERLAAVRAELEDTRRERLQEVEAEAAELRSMRLAEAAAAARHEQARQSARLRADGEALVTGLVEESATVLLRELDEALGDLADSGLEEQAARRFVQHLDALPEEQRAQLRAATAPPVITTALPPEPGTRDLFEDAVRRLTPGGAAPRFEVDPQLLFGAALTAGSLRVEASGRRRLAALRSAFEDAVAHAVREASARSEAEPDGRSGAAGTEGSGNGA